MYLEDFVIGTEIAIPPVVASREEMMDFAEKYDPFLVHTDEEYAKNTRFGGLIAPGLFSFLLVWKPFVDLNVFGDEFIAGKSTKVEWHRPVFPEDVLTGMVRIVDVTRRNPYNGVVTLEMEVRNQNGEVVLTDRTETVVQCRHREDKEKLK